MHYTVDSYSKCTALYCKNYSPCTALLYKITLHVMQCSVDNYSPHTILYCIVDNYSPYTELHYTQFYPCTAQCTVMHTITLPFPCTALHSRQQGCQAEHSTASVHPVLRMNCCQANIQLPRPQCILLGNSSSKFWDQTWQKCHICYRIFKILDHSQNFKSQDPQ